MTALTRAPLDLDARPKGWKHNPSSWAQRVPVAILAGLATAIAGYMACYQWGLVDAAWDPVFGGQTQDVLTSDVSRRMHAWFHVPDAALGAVAYLGDWQLRAMIRWSMFVVTDARATVNQSRSERSFGSRR